MAAVSPLTAGLEQDAATYRRRDVPEDVPGLQREIRRLAKERNAFILAHNYQVPEVQDVADVVGDSLGLSRAAAETDADVIVFCGVHVLSTEGMLRHAKASPRQEFVVATEIGILHRLGREVEDADKRFYAVSQRAVCRYMKKITLPKVLRSLTEDVHRVTVPEPTATRARQALERMVSLG